MARQITPEIENEWVRRISQGEGFCPRENSDPCGDGSMCIGYGHNLQHSGKGWDYVNKFLGKPKDNRSVTRQDAEKLCKEDLKGVYKDLDKNFPWWRDLDSDTQYVMVDMVYTLGMGKFKEFKKTIASIKNGDYGTASREILNSKYAKDTGWRALRNAELMRTGHWFDGRPPKNNLPTRKKTQATQSNQTVASTATNGTGAQTSTQTQTSPTVEPTPATTTTSTQTAVETNTTPAQTNPESEPTPATTSASTDASETTTESDDQTPSEEELRNKRKEERRQKREERREKIKDWFTEQKLNIEKGIEKIKEKNEAKRKEREERREQRRKEKEEKKKERENAANEASSTESSSVTEPTQVTTEQNQTETVSATKTAPSQDVTSATTPTPAQTKAETAREEIRTTMAQDSKEAHKKIETMLNNLNRINGSKRQLKASISEITDAFTQNYGEDAANLVREAMVAPSIVAKELDLRDNNGNYLRTSREIIDRLYEQQADQSQVHNMIMMRNSRGER